MAATKKAAKKKTAPKPASANAAPTKPVRGEASYELIITEKPSSAKKIAEALANSKPIKKTQGKVTWWELTHGSRDIVVASAVGHLYGVVEDKKGKKGWTYPVFDIYWDSLGKGNSDAYIRVLSKLAKGADEVTIATDYDIEGEVIGYTVMAYAAKRKDANRMKYSMLTTPELRASYEQKTNTINWGQAMAGKTRHELDWYYGINLSRALTLSVKSTGGFKILSSGRVQTPALKIVVEKEKEIQAFVPQPYWELALPTKIEDHEVTAPCVNNPFQDEKEAKRVLAASTGDAIVTDISARQTTTAPPHPFDLTSLQTEAYRSLRINPRETLRVAQDLYTSGYISYPRTSSQVLPKELGLPEIIKAIGKQTPYATIAAQLLKKKPLEPNNGKKTDPAHPAIFPTGIAPKGIKGRNAAIYDLVVRRFLSTFGEPAVRETQTVTITKGEGVFAAKGTHTVTPGWHAIYGRHVKLDESILPPVAQGAKLPGTVTIEKKMTQPPRRYTPASIIKELEKRGLGTKATRAEIVQTLYDRGYIDEQSITASELGLVTIETLEKYCPEVLDEAMTREVEEEIERIRAGELKPDVALGTAKTHLTKLLKHFKENEKPIGEVLKVAERNAQDKRSTLGPCPCGGTLQIRQGRFGRFIGCSSYPECTNTFSVPQKGLLRPTGKMCPHDNYPLAKLGSREYCVNPKCPGKPQPDEPASKVCPKCGKKLALRHSFYGSFYGCSSYPKCRYVELSKEVEKGKEEEAS